MPFLASLPLALALPRRLQVLFRDSNMEILFWTPSFGQTSLARGPADWGCPRSAGPIGAVARPFLAAAVVAKALP